MRRLRFRTVDSWPVGSREDLAYRGSASRQAIGARRVEP
jgi:hypothetical protein